MRGYSRLRLSLVSAALFAPAILRGQAFGLNEIGSCAVARAFAVTGSPCHDASTIYWNSAAATWIDGWSLSLGAASVGVKGSFTQDTTGKRYDANPPTKIIPHAFINYHPANSKLALGLGFYYPYGLTSQWGGDFPGRFSADKAALETFYVQPNIAWQITPKWSIGGGPVFGHSDVELVQSIDLSLQHLPTGGTFGQIGVASGTEFARVRLKGSATAYGAQIAIAGHPSPNWSLGARFLSALDFKYDNADATFTQTPTGLIVGATLPGPTQQTTINAGTPVDGIVAGEFAAGGPLTAQKASTSITHPAQIQVGVGYSGYKNWLLEADYAFVGYKRFNNLPITLPANQSLNATYIEDYNNSSAIRLGVEYTIPTDGWKLRAGFDGVASAAPPESVTPLLPEQDRTYFTGGIGIPIMKTWSLDASYAHVATPGARGRVVERASESVTAAQLNSGVYNLSANVFSLTLKANW